MGWNGCKLWASCGGKKCDPSDGRNSRFRTKSFIPIEGRPTWASNEASSTNRCPLLFCDAATWDMLLLWDDWNFLSESSSPFPGSVSEQPAWELEALKVLTAEQSLVDAYRSEVQRHRREMKDRSRG